MLGRHALLGGRRVAGRRDGERQAVFVDQHGPWLLAVGLAIVLLNVLDAWFTLLLLSMGGREMNPLVQVILDWSIPAFLLFKTLGIGLCVAFLALTKNFRAARIGMGVVLVGYALLLAWHLYLLECVIR